MNLYKKNSKQFVSLAVTVSFILLTYLLLTPFLYNAVSEEFTGSGQNIGATEQRLPIKQDKISFLTSVVVENEYAFDITTFHVLSRGQQVNRQLPGLVGYTFIVLLIVFSLLIRKSRCTMGKAKHAPSMLAISMGGHAPPAAWTGLLCSLARG